MIGALIYWLRDLRIRHHHRRAKEFGFAVLAAQINRDWPAAAEFLRYMHDAQAKRDRLIAKQPRACRPDPVPRCCNHDCDEGRRCPARA